MFTKDRERRDAEFTRFVQDAQQSLSATAWFLTGHRETAADLVQSALVKTYLNWPKVGHKQPLAFARRCLINENIDRWRADRHDAALDESRDAGSYRIEDDVATRDEVLRWLWQLPEGQRKAVVLRYFGELSERETADALGISVGAVKSATSRGLAALRELGTTHQSLEGALR